MILRVLRRRSREIKFPKEFYFGRGSAIRRGLRKIKKAKAFLIFRKGSAVSKAFNKTGGNNGQGTPVPIPNTEVKLPSAEDTWMAMSRENRSLPVIYNKLEVEILSLFFMVNGN